MDISRWAVLYFMNTYSVLMYCCLKNDLKINKKLS
uniref:Uncharacterized protein n=1 Tax=Ciona intestinalis TaxID=7719 RepID=H2XKP5_CIOIN